MALQMQITFRHMNHSSQVERWIREEAETLQTFYGRITGCRVAVEVPHRHHQKGKRLHVRIDLNLPGKEIIVKREPAVSPRPRMRATTPTTKPPHADLRLVIHEAFKAAGRRVQDFARRQQGRIKVHQISA